MYYSLNLFLFLFHLLPVVFMGSERFPDENEFDAFIKEQGGGSNAFTDCERVSGIFIITNILT